MIENRKYNFSAGPSCLPEEVLVQVREELLNYNSSGSSVMELSHRGKEFVEIAETAEQNVKDLFNINDDYEVLFLQGGASQQFAMIPQNFLQGRTADYIHSGQWAIKAINEAKVLGNVNMVTDSKENNYTSIANPDSWKTSKDAVYFHYTSNETIGGLQFKSAPKVNIPLVSDMSSDILSREIDINQFALIYAGAQKNIGPAGLTLVIINKEFLKDASTNLPVFYQYKTHIEAKSMYNTPPCFSLYVAGLVFKWMKKIGLKEIENRNEEKAKKLYNFIDSSSFYSNPVDPKFRSSMNIPFILKSEELDAQFLKEAEQENLLNLKGHRSVGGMRASIYNAMPIDGVNKLIDFMKDFEEKNDK